MRVEELSALLAGRTELEFSGNSEASRLRRGNMSASRSRNRHARRPVQFRKTENPRMPGLSIILIIDCSREEGALIKWINTDDSQVFSLTTKHLKVVEIWLHIF